MENEIKKENDKEETVKKDYKKFKSKKSVNWEANADNEKIKTEKKVEIPSDPKDFLEIEVINKDGSTKKEHVKYESKESKEFVKKREEIAHDEYTKAKEFLKNHKNEGE